MNDEIIREISSPYTKNKVWIYNSKDKDIYVKKYIENKEKFENELAAYQLINEKYRPQLIDFDINKKIMICSFNPLSAKKEVEEVVCRLNAFHMSTFQSGFIRKSLLDEENIRLTEYIEKNAVKWKKKIGLDLCNVMKLVEKNLDVISTCNNHYDDMVSIIHRDIRWSNIGEKNQEIVFFDFELAMWGNPIWDLARLYYELDFSENTKEFILRKYNISEKYFFAFVDLYVLSFLAYLYEVSSNNGKEIKKCLKWLKGVYKKWI